MRRFVSWVVVAAACAGLIVMAHTTPRRNPIGGSPPKSMRALPDHYLLLVNTAIAFMMNEVKFKQFEQSPYDGLAVAFLHAYDTSEVPPVTALDAQLKEWKKYTGKDIWPWVYVNRMIGTSADEKNDHSDVPYFHKINGADLDDTQGAQTDFLQIWRNSLAAASDSNMPGVIADLEFYNYYREYDIGELARQTRRTPAQAAEDLKNIGARMADVAAEQYPGATLWFLWMGFTHPGYKTYDGVPYYPSPTYIAMGLLNEIAQKKLNLRVLTGGEGSLAYCHDTLGDFQTAIAKREMDLRGTLDKYKGILEMAGTMTLWRDRASNGVCKTASANSIEDLQSYLELLLKSYRYNWIWGSADGGYLAFAPETAPRFDAVIRRAQASSRETSRIRP
jgi:hypothetical protein